MLTPETANLVYTVTLSIYHLVINLTNSRDFRLKLPKGAQSGAPFRIFFLLNTMNESLAPNLLSQGIIEQDYLSKNIKKSVFVVLIKASIDVVNFSTELAKKPTIYDLLFLIAIYSPENDNKLSCNMRN